MTEYSGNGSVPVAQNSMIYQVDHSTIYTYDETVPLCQNAVHLRPRDTFRQKCHGFQLVSEPACASRVDRLDYFGNHFSLLTIQDPHRELLVRSRSRVQVEPGMLTLETLADTGLEPWERVRGFLCEDLSSDGLDARQFLVPSPYIKPSSELRRFTLDCFPPGIPLAEACVKLMHRINKEFTYDPAATTLATPLPEVLQRKRGVCQDFAHLMIGALRSIGLAARYVSGYLRTYPPPGQPRLVGSDASHAWMSVYCPGYGWIDMDPTNNSLPSDEHITVAWGRDYGDVSPVRGVILGGRNHAMKISVDVLPLDDEEAAAESPDPEPAME